MGGAGTPSVSEFLVLELAGLLECSQPAAASQLADALNLKHRHPRLWGAVIELGIEARRACKAATKCAELPIDVAGQVTDRWYPKQAKLGWTAAFNLLDKLIIEADPAAAAEREAKARAQRGVHIWGLHDGAINLTGRLDVLDGKLLDAALERMAEVLAPQHPNTPKEQLRAKAVGVLANPAYATALLQQAALADPLFGSHCQGDVAASGEVTRQASVHVDDHRPDGQDCGRQHRRGPQCLGALCGTISVPLSRLRPRLELAVHVSADAVEGLSPVARVEKAGHLTSRAIGELLGEGFDVTVQPVIDLPELPAEPQYVPSVRMRRAAWLAMPTETFPFSHRSSAGLDFEHTAPFSREHNSNQTGLHNVGWLGRRAHRAKTAGVWRVQQTAPGRFHYRSPLDFAYDVSSQGTRIRR
ncbi:MAG TPA: DUF222 domain-containing protein [Tessaracoccus flavescens]|uniref:DUF222 domain-containing protein n=1 Tax=Tessaracoccus flavescens TaxID=399497 RepID=A0A921EPN3_9ACTN|nr:DUF222 domain-containing protein [Tessaracoccus flavescens]